MATSDHPITQWGGMPWPRAFLLLPSSCLPHLRADHQIQSSHLISSFKQGWFCTRSCPPCSHQESRRAMRGYHCWVSGTDLIESLQRLVEQVCFPHFTDEETALVRLSTSLQVTQVRAGGSTGDSPSLSPSLSCLVES